MSFQQFINTITFRKLLVLRIMVSIVVIGALTTLLMPKQYVARATVVVDQRTVDVLTGLLIPNQMVPGYMATQANILASHGTARKVVEKLKLQETPQLQEDFAKGDNHFDIVDWIADLILIKLEVTPAREGTLMTVAYTAVDPQFAAIMANTFVDSYMDISVGLRAQPAKLSADWFDSQLQTLRERVKETQGKLSDYQQKTGIVQIDDRLDIEAERLSVLSRQLVENQARTDQLRSRKNLVNGKLKEGKSAEAIQEVLSSSLISNIKAELAQKEANLAMLSKRLDKNHPLYRQAEAEVNSMQNKIVSEIKTVQHGIDSELESSIKRDEFLAKALADQKAKVLELKKQHDVLAVLSHDVENAQKSYDSAMLRSTQTRMESKLDNTTNLSVLNKAVPPEAPEKPKSLLIIAMSIVMGGFLGVFIALVAELMDRRVRAVADINYVLGLPVLAVLSAAEPVGVNKQKPA